MNSKKQRIAIVAGEPSGDNLGANLIKEIHSTAPNIQFFGVGGAKMQSAGCKILYNMDKIGVIGLDGLFKKLYDIFEIRRSLYKLCISKEIDLFIGIDVPDFNLTLENKIKKKGIPCVHYVSPTVWAWRGYRIHKIQKSITHMLTLFPFEAEYYRDKSIPVTFIGHPIADEIENSDRTRARSKLKNNVDTKQLVIALLPGSRKSEIRKLGQLFIEVIERLHTMLNNIQFMIPFVNREIKIFFQKTTKSVKNLPIQLIEGKSRLIMEASNIVILACGTASLEASLLRRPHVVIYKIDAFSYWILKKLIYINYYSIPNNLLRKPIVPEFIQQNATVENIVGAVIDYLDTPNKTKELEHDFSIIHQKLKLNANLKAKKLILNLIKSNN